MSENAAPQCEYCQRFGHTEADCPDRKSDERFERICGWALFVLLAPFAFLGLLAGWVVGAVRAGYGFSSGMWAANWKLLFTRAERKEPS